MAKKVLTVAEVLEEISAKPKKDGKVVINKFNKKKFEALMRAIINDSEYTTKCAVTKGGELIEVVDIAVSKGFRNFIKKIIESAGVDKAESERVLAKEFTVDSVDGLYEFFTTALYEYINAGNKFELMPKEDFKGSILLKQRPSSKKVAEAYHPTTRESLGTFETTKKPYKQLSIKSSCPAYLKSRKKVK